MNWKKLISLTRETLSNLNYQYFCELERSLEYSIRPTSNVWAGAPSSTWNC